MVANALINMYGCKKLKVGVRLRVMISISNNQNYECYILLHI